MSAQRLAECDCFPRILNNVRATTVPVAIRYHQPVHNFRSIHRALVNRLSRTHDRPHRGLWFKMELWPIRGCRVRIAQLIKDVSEHIRRIVWFPPAFEDSLNIGSNSAPKPELEPYAAAIRKLATDTNLRDLTTALKNVSHNDGSRFRHGTQDRHEFAEQLLQHAFEFANDTADHSRKERHLEPSGFPAIGPSSTAIARPNPAAVIIRTDPSAGFLWNSRSSAKRPRSWKRKSETGSGRSRYQPYSKPLAAEVVSLSGL